MSFSSFISKVVTDFQHIESIFIKLFKTAPSWVQVAKTDIGFIAPVLMTILELAGGPTVAVEAAAVIATIQNDMVLAVKFIDAVDASQNLTDVLNAISTSIGSILQIGQIKNSAKVSEITAYVNAFVAEIDAIIAAVKGAATPTA